MFDIYLYLISQLLTRFNCLAENDENPIESEILHVYYLKIAGADLFK